MDEAVYLTVCSSRMIRAGQEVKMNQDQLDRIARVLYRISDRSERREVTREVADVLAAEDTGFDRRRFYELANVEYPDGS